MEENVAFQVETHTSCISANETINWKEVPKREQCVSISVTSVEHVSVEHVFSPSQLSSDNTQMLQKFTEKRMRQIFTIYS